MNRRYDRYLTQKYAPLYRDRYNDMQSTAMCWGFEVGDGWFDIINNLSYQLCYNWLVAKDQYNWISSRLGQSLYNGTTNQDNHVVTQMHVDQARSEMETQAEQVPVATQVKEKYGALRFYTDYATDAQQAYIDFAEGMSTRVCEVCGNRGKRKGYSWVTTRCRQHWNQ